MAITYAWSFPQFDCAPSEDGLTDVVKVIHWRLDGFDGQYTAGAYGSVALGAPNPAAFTPFASITEQWAIDAVSSSEGFDLPGVKEAIAGQIQAQKKPKIVPLPPPFAASA